VHSLRRASGLVLSVSCASLQGLGAMELDNLRDWEAKFNYKYPIVGRVV
jgi:hypothetical protein